MAILQNFSASLRLGEKKIKQLFSQRRRDAKGTKQQREVFFHLACNFCPVAFALCNCIKVFAPCYIVFEIAAACADVAIKISCAFAPSPNHYALAFDTANSIPQFVNCFCIAFNTGSVFHILKFSFMILRITNK